MASRGIPVAQLSTITLAQIRAQDPAEMGELEKAASTCGFFFLNLRGDVEGEAMLSHAPSMYAIAQKYFSQPDGVKAKDARVDLKPSQDLGWKKGRGAEGFEVGSPALRFA